MGKTSEYKELEKKYSKVLAALEAAHAPLLLHVENIFVACTVGDDFSDELACSTKHGLKDIEKIPEFLSDTITYCLEQAQHLETIDNGRDLASLYREIADAAANVQTILLDREKTALGTLVGMFDKIIELLDARGETLREEVDVEPAIALLTVAEGFCNDVALQQKDYDEEMAAKHEEYKTQLPERRAELEARKQDVAGVRQAHAELEAEVNLQPELEAVLADERLCTADAETIATQCADARDLREQKKAVYTEKRQGFVRARDAARVSTRQNEERADAVAEKIKELQATEVQFRLKAARCMEDENRAERNIENIDKAQSDSEQQFERLFDRWAVRTAGDAALMNAAQYVQELALTLGDKLKSYDRAQQTAATSQIEKLCTLLCLHDSREAGLHLFNVRALNSDLEDYQRELRDLNEKRSKAQTKLRFKDVAAMKPRIEELTQLIEGVKADLRVQMAKDAEINSRWMDARSELEEVRATQRGDVTVPAPGASSAAAPAPAPAAAPTNDDPPAYYEPIPVTYPGFSTEVDSPQAFRDKLNGLSSRKMLTDGNEENADEDAVVVPVLAA